MNPKEIVKPSSKTSHTPILKKTQKEIKKINSKFIDDNDDLEKHTAFIVEDEELQRNIIVTVSIVDMNTLIKDTA